MSDLSDDLFKDDEEKPESGDGAPKDPSTDSKDPKSSDKRVRDLQSKADQETARANKAEAKLKAMLEAAADRDAGGGSAPVPGDASGALLDMARMFAVQQNPKLAEYGVSMSDLSGSTPREIAQSAAEQVARFEKLETQVRNKVLAANGLAPEVGGDIAPAPSRDFSKMSSEDFKKVMDAALNQ